MNIEPLLPNLHDAILIRMHVDWADASATLELERVPDVPIVLVAQGLYEFGLTHRQEWGPSVSVNTVTSETDSAGRVSVDIQMQSGDHIKFVAERCDVM
jgi:hypothetical protein